MTKDPVKMMPHDLEKGEKMTLKEMIYCRKSCRSFTGKPVDAETLEKIRAFAMKPLYPEIKVRMEIVERDQVRSVCPWILPQLIAVYAEKTDGYLENAGFMFQQMDLYLQTLGLGVCWLGLGRMHPKTAPQVNGMQFVILLAFGYPKGEPIRRTVKEFKRKSMGKIADMDDDRLEPARLAPSAVNGQPWYFTHDGDMLHVYCSYKGSRLDAGIALAHLYITNPQAFRFFKAAQVPDMIGYRYVGSVQI